MRYLNSLFFVAAIVACVSSGSAFAAGRPGSGPSPYVDCGVGASLFPDTHWAAVTSNITWDLGSTALTSATSSPETCNAKKVKAAMFIRDTYPNVIEETASAQGEHLVAMLQLFSCSKDAHPAIIQSVRGKLAPQVALDSYASMTHLEKAAQYYEAVNSSVENDFASSCSA